MVRRISRRSEDETLLHKLWFNIILAVVSLLLAYGLGSWAINTGNLLLWAATIFFVSWAINRLVLGILYAVR